MKYITFLAGLFGISLTVLMVWQFGFYAILSLIFSVSWGIIPIVGFHATQLACTAWAWKKIGTTFNHHLSFRYFFLIRSIREGINDLLPVAQIGGDIIGTRMVAYRGLSFSQATATVITDLTMELASQVIFIVMGVSLLVLSVKDVSHTGQIIDGIGLLLAGICFFVGVQYLGGISLVEKLMIRLAHQHGWSKAEELRGLDKNIRQIYHRKKNVFLALMAQFLGWALGTGEVYIILYYMGVPKPLLACFIIESVGQVVKSAGFVVPGGLGVSEWGLVFVGGVFGLSPQEGITLSLLKRIREIGWGVPSLLLWQWVESKHKALAPLELTPLMATKTYEGVCSKNDADDKV
ncbi:flippase-like domain-containing protein [Entomobacter blattae]|uniref:Lysylphosphatidylglycerol synthase TM region n=1 Tax=Entomobacter blattae TaxID=2762277 RepID=A0A7H1NP35_9PROT|nr:flippase-like domain-containing protein [Entomobacter blattae]QNT77545.1 Lysylphosphatidylglycerol synthase TM region [Entomobacter blattae]